MSDAEFSGAVVITIVILGALFLVGVWAMVSR